MYIPEHKKKHSKFLSIFPQTDRDQLPKDADVNLRLYLAFPLGFVAGAGPHLQLFEQRSLRLRKGGKPREQQLHHVRQTVLNSLGVYTK